MFDVIFLFSFWIRVHNEFYYDYIVREKEEKWVYKILNKIQKLNKNNNLEKKVLEKYKNVANFIFKEKKR